MTLKTVRIAAWAAVAIVVVVVAGMALFPRFLPSEVPVPVAATIGGPFELQDQSGATVTYDDLRGQKSALFFGYTNCPDVCPTTLMEATTWLEALGDRSDDLNVYFVTVDPERDTQDLLAEYMEAFDPRIRGLTGDRAAVDEVIESFRVYAAKVETDDPDYYLMDHTASVYLLDDEAQLVSTISYEEDPDVAMEKLRRLLAG